jgi:NADH:ubiquinone oxidoreductase subunit 3 (subunit A)
MNNNSSIDLVNLQKQYSTLLDKYKTAVYEYTSDLSNNDANNSNVNAFITVKGRAFNGTGSAGESDATELNECQAECSNLKSCSGATFISSSNKCLLRSGDSNVLSATEDYYAIIPKSKQLLLNMEDINQQLLSKNKEILEKMRESKSDYIENNEEIKNNTQELIDNYNQLTQEREQIEMLINEYETLNEAEGENIIKINQNYYSYLLLFILAGIIIFILYKVSSSAPTNGSQSVQYGGDLGYSAYYMIFGILFIIGFIFYVKKTM